MNDSEVTVDASRSMLKDEGYQSALQCSSSKHVEKKLLEKYCKQQSSDVEFELKLRHELIKKVYNDELMDDEDDYEEQDEEEFKYKGKGKGGKGFVKKTCHLEEEEQQVKLKEQYLGKIKSEKKYLRFQQLDDLTQLMICKIDALRESGSDYNFYDKLLKLLEWKSMKLEDLKQTIKEMKEIEDDNTKTMNGILLEHQMILHNKDQEINCLKKRLELWDKRRGCLEETSKNTERKCKKIEGLDDEYQTMIANMEALKKLNNNAHNKVLKLLGEAAKRPI